MRLARVENGIVLNLAVFKDEDEIYYALLLANKIQFYNENEIDHLWKLILNNRTLYYLLDLKKPSYKGKSAISKWFEAYLQNSCLFISIGDATDITKIAICRF